MASECPACGRPLAVFEACSCGGGPSMTSARHPVRLDVRAIAMLVASPVLAVIGVVQLTDPHADHGRAAIALCMAAAFGAIGGWWLRQRLS